MGMNIYRGDVLNAKADALIITIDGAAKGMEGNVARSFAKRWPEVWDEIENEISYPLPLGTVFDYEPSAESPFRLILVASTLNHKDTLTETAKKGIVRSALSEAVALGETYGVQNIACAIMSGGWRLSTSSAFLAMTEAVESAERNGINIDIYISDDNTFEIISSIARGVGWRGSASIGPTMDD